MKDQSIVKKIYRKFTGNDPVDMSRLPQSGSDRVYFRIIETNRSIIGVYNPDRVENNTFIGFSNHFAAQNLPVPEIFAWFPDDNVYFLQDLGDLNLYTWLERRRQLTGMDEMVSDFFRLTLDKLIMFQTKGAQNLDIDLCYPHKSFDRQSMMWDMNYFKYMFLKLVLVPFNEQRLEKDFNHLAGMLLEAGEDFFLYRDFQSANIMVVDGEPWFIDYQGGRMGAPQYDPASLLYDSKAHIPQQMREIMLEYYVEKFCTATGYDESQFRDMYPGFVLIRIMQALGAYGFRGLYEQKPGFVRSIIPAIRDINSVIDQGSMEAKLPELASVLKTIPEIIHSSGICLE
ncbi:MAG: phosphotransferase [Bacteroidales bacterium]|nr:phosphotransferase [Bacteroidales bacterium]